MPIHAVAFTDIVRFEGDTPIQIGRALINEYYDTAAYKNRQPGDREQPYPHRPWVAYDFVEPKPFVADLTISTEYGFGAAYVALYDSKTDTYYPMFHLDFIAMATKAIIVRGRITGRFGYVKKNKNFGIVHLGEA